MRSFARSALYLHFGDMAFEFAAKMEDLNKKVKESGDPAFGSSESMAHHQLGVQRDRMALATIVFAAMLVEAFINDYAAIALGQDFFDQYIDKMDLKAKWAVVPRLVSGRALASVENPGEGAINRLNQLIRARNFLVHYKSVDLAAVIAKAVDKGHIIYTDDAMISPAGAPNPFAKLDFDAVGEAINAVGAIRALAQELDDVDAEALAIISLSRKLQ